MQQSEWTKRRTINKSNTTDRQTSSWLFFAANSIFSESRRRRRCCPLTRRPRRAEDKAPYCTLSVAATTSQMSKRLISNSFCRRRRCFVFSELAVMMKKCFFPLLVTDTQIGGRAKLLLKRRHLFPALYSYRRLVHISRGGKKVACKFVLFLEPTNDSVLSSLSRPLT